VAPALRLTGGAVQIALPRLDIYDLRGGLPAGGGDGDAIIRAGDPRAITGVSTAAYVPLI
jgi:hypothetical protein